MPSGGLAREVCARGGPHAVDFAYDSEKVSDAAKVWTHAPVDYKRHDKEQRENKKVLQRFSFKAPSNDFIADCFQRVLFERLSTRVGRGVLLLFELRAQFGKLPVRGVCLLKLAEPRLCLTKIARLDERGRKALQDHLVFRVCL